MKENIQSMLNDPSGRSFLYRKRFLLFLIISCGMLFAALSYLFRALWFDEVLTMEVFVHPLPLSRIYFSYFP